MTTIDRAPDIRPKASPSLVALGEYGGAGEIELAALEDEIVIPIIDLVHAEDTDDIVSFSCCNKRISLLSEGMLKKHKEMKEYRELEFGNHTNHQPIDVGLFLRAILNNEALARYPTKIRIRECFGTFYDRSRTWQWEEHDVTVAALADCRDAILAKIEACPYIEPRMQGRVLDTKHLQWQRIDSCSTPHALSPKFEIDHDIQLNRKSQSLAAINLKHRYCKSNEYAKPPYSSQQAVSLEVRV